MFHGKLWLHQNARYCGFKTVRGYLGRTENHNCSLRAGFCSCIIISHQTFSSFDALPWHDTCSSVEDMRAGSTRVKSHGKIWEENVSQFWFFTPKMMLPTDKSTHKGYVQRLGFLTGTAWPLLSWYPFPVGLPIDCTLALQQHAVGCGMFFLMVDPSKWLN